MSDQEKIEILKKRYDLTKDQDILALSAAIQSGEITFDGKEGQDFDDEIYEKALAIEKNGGPRNSGDAVSRGGKLPVRAGGAGREGKSRVSAAKSSGFSSSRTAGTSTKDVSRASQNGSTTSQKKVIVLTKSQLRARRLGIALLFVLAVAFLSYFSYYCYQAYMVDVQNAKLAATKDNDTVNDMYADTVEEVDEGETTKTYKVLSKFKSLYSQNQNLIGWLTIADTIIDYPVMQTGDNEYYLTHSFYLDDDNNGTLFLDMDCDIKKPSTNYIIYGHNMRSGKMFGTLSKYEDASYYEAHKEITFDTIYEEATYQVMYVFRSHVYEADDVSFKYYQFIDANSEAEFNSAMKEMAEMSFYDTGVTASYGDQLLTLTTCDYEESDGRFVVVAKRVK